ncbi:MULTISPECIES: serine hydrolase domain-containing protein [Streptococcus]|uniref:Methicillin resistance protein FmtA n=1 Tax=Streptococcus panodentis TaxID=1581472 RepID=A0ABS5AW60_9STRE|nr:MULTISPECIES: serine hydrolase domain-containing protein [Streptococcus]MBP2619969.1 methicillin resistance protein FmtA [Streptococcus panodentis]MBZ2021737.1 beta-lactamase family protein [Streptococcus sanguinis]MBZ2073582.1 beta-lactamase family protein [Streptococcus sanguinis]MBZ2081506.1 beta-lactamase family protein [Streptococcus sanguinis]MCC3166228.1 beta-lactamase family protein [Streptococcus sanguinis]
MNKTIFIWLLTVFSLGLLRVESVQAAEVQLPSGTPASQISQKIEDFVKEHEKTTAGMETAVFDTKGSIYRGNFGYMDKEKGVKADDDSVFEWGSVTKLTVWVSVMQLWEEGKIDLEEDIRTYLPEGFLKNLRYDKPITVLDLMNHQAGFEESSHAFMENKGQTLEEILAVGQPAQIFEPGTMTGYSNWSTGLAAYIVERLSSQSFADYVHEHIFQPLDMDKTSLLPDFADNAYVQEKRKEELTYDTEGKSLGLNYMKMGLYPAGDAAGTMEDFLKFAQALLKKEKLFQRSETWTTLYTATSTYPETDLPLNLHGFWTQEYGTTVVGHGGNSFGFSSYLLLDLKNGIGMTIMTNQKNEQVYNYEMPELVFGPKKKTDKATFENFQPGYYQSARYFASGPLSISRAITPYVGKSADNLLLAQNYAVVSGQGDQVKVTAAYGDFFRIKDSDLLKDWGMLALAAMAAVVSLLTFLLRGGLDLFRLVFKKGPSKTPKNLRVWTYVSSAAVLAVVLNLALLFTAQPTDTSILASWRFMVFAGLGLLLAGCTLYPLVSKTRKGLSKGRIFLTALTSLSALAVVANILYWSLYQWWVL